MMNAETFKHYMTHIADRDAEHMLIYECINRLKVSIKQKNFKEAVEDAVELYNDIVNHFVEEEAYMKSIGFPYVDYHAESHKKIESCAKTIRKQIVDDKNPNYYSVDEFDVMFTRHVDEQDRQYAVWVKK